MSDTAFAPCGAGYPTSHCWYYRTGGTILPAQSIIHMIDQQPVDIWHAEHFARFANMEEPRRSNEIRKEQDTITESLKRDVEVYDRLTAEILELRVFIGPPIDDWFKRTYNCPYTGISLKHNHICYAAKELKALAVHKPQEQLFDQLGQSQKPYRSEFTEAGEQCVIPGCEADDKRTGATQLDLF